MRYFWQIIWFLFPTVALAQTAPPVGDIYQSGTPQPVQQSFQRLYNLAAEITADPSFDYRQAQADKTNWPDIAKAQAEWDAAVSESGTALSQQERNDIVPCVAHLNAAIDAMERGYLISQTQQSSPLSARTVVTLYGKGRVEFAKCLATGISTDGTPGTDGGTPGTPGGEPETGTPGTNGEPKSPNPENTPANTGGTPGTTPGSEPTDLPPGVVALSCSYNVQRDTVPGADPPLRYQTGFNQAVAKCLQNQCTSGNLAAAVFAARFKVVRAILSLSVVPAFLQVVMSPPGFSQSSDPYTRGEEEGTSLCNYALQVATLAGAATARTPQTEPPVIPVKRMVLPDVPVSGEQPAPNPVIGGQAPPPQSEPFNPQQAAATISQWIKEINSTGCNKNCGLATINAIRVMFGEILMAAPKVEEGMTEPEMEDYLGTKFTQDHLSDVQMNSYLSGKPDGTIAVIAGRPAAGGEGHFFWSIKWNGQMEYWDAQSGVPMSAKSVAGWNFDINVVGNPFQK